MDNSDCEVPWTTELEGLQNPAGQADPGDGFPLTKLFFEAGLQLADEDLRKGDSPAYGWGPITMAKVVPRALKLAKERNLDLDGNKVTSGKGAFKQRWRHIADFRGDLATYAAYSTRWRDALESARRELLDGLDDVAKGHRQFSDLILSVTARNMKLRLRFARYVIFQLTLTVDAAYARRVCKADRVFSERYAQHWLNAYEEALRILGFKLRPDVNLEILGRLFSCLAQGLTVFAFDNDDDSLTRDDEGNSLLGHGVALMVAAVIDRGDGGTVYELLDGSARQIRAV